MASHGDSIDNDERVEDNEGNVDLQPENDLRPDLDDEIIASNLMMLDRQP